MWYGAHTLCVYVYHIYVCKHETLKRQLMKRNEDLGALQVHTHTLCVCVPNVCVHYVCVEILKRQLMKRNEDLEAL